MTVFHDLLRVQDHDTAADRLRHRRQTLPELAELRACEDELARLETTMAQVGAGAAEAARLQRRVEGELALLESKVSELDAKLYSGAVTVPRELQAMQTEGDAMRQRRASLEDEVLEAMGARETLDEQLGQLESRREELDREGVRLRAAVAEGQAGVDRDLEAELAARQAAAAAIPADVTALYEQLRARLGGVAAAPRVNGRCGGCHLALPATELDRLRKEPADTLVRCEQCERILVRP
ncbi:MAG TPA: C4-type zinc ribbon domain-containing protein [Acidimicrobiales bacterium]|nr:C4-type zinc ribbon domain-containing protein [Acidimicrobiales bacterium]